MDGSEFDSARRDQVRDHIAGLMSAVASVQQAAAARPEGVEREQMSALASRLQRSLDQLQGELDACAHPRATAPAAADASARD